MAEQFSGTIDIRDSASNRRTIELAGDHGEISAGGNDKPGAILLFPEDGGLGHLATATVELNGQHANLRMGSNQADGDIVLQSMDGRDRIHLDAGAADIHLGGGGRNGNLLIHHYLGDHQPIETTTIHLIGETGVVRAGGNGAWGAVVVRGLNNQDYIRLMSAEASIHVGGNGSRGALFVYPSEGDNYESAQATIHLNGSSGDIILRNADCAEDFDVPDDVEIEPGAVVVIENEEGGLRQCTQAYDKKVAGVISGAGDYGPGIVLGRQQARKGRLPVALTGKVYCKVDAQYSSIEVGDLLTTSPTPGYAMRAADPLRAFGAVIGKALRPLNGGRGLIPILVALQ